jgi:cysteine desulfurase
VGCEPLLHGGGQERDVRSGTLDVAGITSFATAVEIAIKGQAEFASRVGALRDDLVARVRSVVPGRGAQRRSRPAAAGQRPLLVPGLRGRRAAAAPGRGRHRLLDRFGLLGRIAQPSHVLIAMGATRPCAKSTLRFTLGHTSTGQDVADLIASASWCGGAGTPRGCGPVRRRGVTATLDRWQMKVLAAMSGGVGLGGRGRSGG